MLKSLAKFVLLCTGAIAAFGAEPKIARDLEGVDPASTVDVIVQYAKTPTAEDHQRILNRGGKFKRDLSIIKAGHYSLPASALSALAKDSNVVAISPDREIRGTLDLTAQAVNAPVAWQTYGLNGDDIGVAVIDSGIDTSRDLPASQVVYSQSYVAGGTQDNYGHGTHVAGIIASNGHSSSCDNCFRTFLGIASGVNLINLRVLDQNGNGTDSNVIAALQTAVSLKSTYHIRVINLSVGRPVFESYKQDPLCQAVEAAWKAGIVVVVAAGNDGRDNSQNTNGYMTITAPGNDPYVITVGAMKTEGTATRTDDLVVTASAELRGRQQALLEALLQLGKTVNVQVVAQGIETPEQVSQLLRMGCLYGQGPMLAAAMDPTFAFRVAETRSGPVVSRR